MNLGNHQTCINSLAVGLYRNTDLENIRCSNFYTYLKCNDEWVWKRSVCVFLFVCLLCENSG